MSRSSGWKKPESRKQVEVKLSPSAPPKQSAPQDSGDSGRSKRRQQPRRTTQSAHQLFQESRQEYEHSRAVVCNGIAQQQQLQHKPPPKAEVPSSSSTSLSSPTTTSSAATIYFNSVQHEHELDRKSPMRDKQLAKTHDERSISNRLNPGRGSLSSIDEECIQEKDEQIQKLQRTVKQLQKQRSGLEELLFQARKRADLIKVESTLRIAQMEIDMDTMREDNEYLKDKCRAMESKLQKAWMDQAEQRIRMDKLLADQQKYRHRIQAGRRAPPADQKGTNNTT